MRRFITTAALLGFLGLSSLPAQADVRWLGFGPRFLIGGINFVLSFGQPGLSYPRGNYYRTTNLIVSHGARCSSACFHSGAVYYHHEGCPLVREHFARLGYDPYDVYSRYAPHQFRDGRSYGYDELYANDRYDDYDDYANRDERYSDRYYNRYGSGGYPYGQGGFVIQYGNPYGGRGYGYGGYSSHGGRGYGSHGGYGHRDNRDYGHRDNQGYGHRDGQGYGQRGGSRGGNWQQGSRGDRGRGHEGHDRNDSGRGGHRGRSSGSHR